MWIWGLERGNKNSTDASGRSNCKDIVDTTETR